MINAKLNFNVRGVSQVSNVVETVDFGCNLNIVDIFLWNATGSASQVKTLKARRSRQRIKLVPVLPVF